MFNSEGVPPALVAGDADPPLSVLSQSCCTASVPAVSLIVICVRYPSVVTDGVSTSNVAPVVVAADVNGIIARK
jgi:hypothetical protein